MYIDLHTDGLKKTLLFQGCFLEMAPAMVTVSWMQTPRTRRRYMCAKSVQSCLTLCNPMTYSPTDSLVHGILQEYWSGLPHPSTQRSNPVSCIADRFFTVWAKSLVWLLVIVWTIACQAPLSMGFSRQEHWSGLPGPPPEDLPNSMNEPMSFFFFSYCSGFCHTLTSISPGFTCVPHPDPPSHLPPHPIPLGLPSAPGLSTCLMHPTWAGDLFHPR